MQMIKIVNTSKAPVAIGPYSQAIVVNGFIFCSGQIGIDPQKNEFHGGIEKQTLQALENLREVLVAGNASIETVVKTTIYMKNIEDFSTVNKIYTEFFGEHKPARATVEVSSLPKGALIEIEAIAAIKE